MLLAHTDVVPAPPYGWSVDPFEGAVRDERLIGRGAVDMKNELAARAVAFAALARSGRAAAGRRRPGRRVRRGAQRIGRRHVVAGARASRPALRPGPQRGRRGAARARRRRPGGAGLDRREGGHRRPAAAASAPAATPRCPTAPTTRSGTRRARSSGCSPTGRRLRLEAGVRGALLELGAPPGDDAARSPGPGRENPTLGRLVAATARMTIAPTGALATEPPNVIPPLRRRGLRLPGPARRGRGRDPRPDRRRARRLAALRGRVPRAAGRRHPVVDRLAALRRARALSRRPGARRSGAAADRRRVHRLALGARRLGNRGLRLRPGAPRRPRLLPRRGARHRRVARRSTTWSRWRSSTCSRFASSAGRR